MKKLMMMIAVAAFAVAFTGCATKSRSFDAKGMYVSETGQLAVGYVHVDAIPDGVESAVVHYEEDVALLSPSTKTHDIDIILTGTNSVSSSEGVVKAICEAFVKVAPRIAEVNADVAKQGATSPLDLAKSNSDAQKAIKLAKVAASEVKAAASDAKAAASDAKAVTSEAKAATSDAVTAVQAAECADGACKACTTGECGDK